MASFNQLVKKNFVGVAGATVQAFVAPWAAYSGAKIALTGITSGSIASATTTANALVIALAGMNGIDTNIEWGSVSANVQTGLTTNLITAALIWQVSNDATNWVTLSRLANTAPPVFAPAGTASLVTTTYVQYLPGYNPGYQYLRPAVLVGGATGGAGDNVVISFNARKRQTAA